MWHAFYLLPFAFGLLLMGMSACAASPLPPLPENGVRAQLQRDGLIFTLDSQADPQINTTQHLRVTLLDAAGRPVDASSVYFDLDMDMLCLSHSAPVANPVGNGSYEVDVVYVMAGDWRVKTVAELDDRTFEVTFPISVAE